MKKILSLFIIPLLSLFFVTEVKAEEKYLQFSEDFSLIQESISNIGYDVFNLGINDVITYYKENYYNENPYYYISIILDDSEKPYISLHCFPKSHIDDIFSYFKQSGSSRYELVNPSVQIYFSYNTSLNYFSFDTSSDILGFYSSFPFFTFNSSINIFNPYLYYYSNFDYYYYGTSLSEFQESSSYPLSYLSVDDILYVPLYDNSTTYSVYRSTEDFLIKPYYLYDENSTLEPDSDIYTTIDLNNYAYVALSLKNYDVEEFDSTFYVKGQLCPTIVYNYGLDERINSDRCNIPFDNFTPIRYRISSNDINNHFIYYFKAYDTSIENKVKVDSSIFNIHYITEEEKNNPILDINGYKYSAIPFDKLSSTANKNESENFVPGSSEETSFSDIFIAPLEFLKTIWNSIISVFGLITDFISLLPIELQSLLYAGFALALTLGIIKILL